MRLTNHFLSICSFLGSLLFVACGHWAWRRWCSFFWLVRLVHYLLVEPIPLIEMVIIIGTYNINISAIWIFPA